MSEMIYVSKKHKVEFTICKRNHIWIYVTLTMLDKTGTALLMSDEEEMKKIFIFDTGAQNTILSRNRAVDLGYHYCETKDKTKVSIGGNIILCSKVKIPDIIITNDIAVTKPIVLIPDDYTYNMNILGQDILRQFNYYMDNQSHNIYFDIENREHEPFI